MFGEGRLATLPASVTKTERSSVITSRHARWWRGSAAVLSGLTVVALSASVTEASAAAGVTGTIKKSLLTVTGTTAVDAITLRLRAGDPSKLEVDVGADGTADLAFDRQRFQAIVVDGREGDDTIVVNQSNGAFTDTETTTFRGGDGNDTLIGGYGSETLVGLAGADYLDGNQGADTIDAGDGADVVAWDPGDASDIVTGGAGADRLVFNGGGVGESIGLAAVGDRVRLSRDVGSVGLDLDALETLELRTVGGADTVTVHDLTGTDLTEVHTDLAPFGGSDDGQPDTVSVPAGVVVGQDGPAAVVDGLGARVRVVNGAVGDQIRVTGTGLADAVTLAGTAGADTVAAYADGTDVVVVGGTAGMPLRLTGVDLLAADLAGGDDAFSTTGNLAALVALDVAGGDGNDTLLGGNGADRLAGGAGADYLDGNQGADTIDAGDGADVVAWDPGDASDIVTGGAGADRLVFNGGGVGESIGLAAVGDRVRLSRDVGSVGLDLDALETLELRTVGGADTVTVHDLTGTDLTEVHTDLAAIGGTAGDSVGDEVIVNGTASDDAISVVDEGSAVVVGGLASTVRLTHADPTLDRLTVNGLDGNDSVTATPVAAALILLNLLP